MLLAAGAVFTVGVDLQRALPLRMPLADALPGVVAGRTGRDVRIGEEEVAVAGVTDYVMRYYESPDSTVPDPAFSVYVGYYDSQAQGTTIHSPKNCLPGAGWETLASTHIDIPTADGPVRVNRYLLQKGAAQALVLYWYQGRGRVEHNEYVLKWDLLRDAALRQRSDEALVRVVVPLAGNEEAALDLARQAAQALIPAVDAALPE